MPRLLLLGASGLVGSNLARLLAGRPEVIALVRRHLPELPVAQEVMAELSIATHCDVVLCAVGTTLARAGSKEAFVAVDLELVVQLADAALRHGASTFIAVSATGADPSSSLLYNRTKGELEAALRLLEFPRLGLLRPSLLLGERVESRPLEALARKTLGAIDWALPAAKRPVPASTVARAALALADDPTWSGCRVMENDELFGYG
jgi:uncharacterized protein YbjT (DUF2867 family)